MLKIVIFIFIEFKNIIILGIFRSFHIFPTNMKTTLRDFSFEKLINAEPKFSILCFKIGKRGYLYQKLINALAIKIDIFV